MRDVNVRLSLYALTATAAVVVSAVVPHAQHHERPPVAPAAHTASPRGPSTSSTTPTVAFDRAERLWAVWVEGARVFVASSKDAGKTFTGAVNVTPAGEVIDANGESRPKIALGPGGEIYVTWTRSGKERFTGDIRFSRSIDGGRTFSPARTLNDDGRETGHRFDELQVGPTGTVYVAWIDKRDLDDAEHAGRPYHGAALYYTHSTNRGATFAPNRKLKDHVCECCRIAIDFDGAEPVVFWRDIVGTNTRDHGILRFRDALTPGSPTRATHDGWNIDACPHHGPSLSIAEDGTYHMVWFTGEGPLGPGAFYARSRDDGKTMTPPVRVGTERTFGHAAVLSRGRHVYMVVKESVEPAGMSVQVYVSADGGASWSKPREALRTSGTSDHPFLLERGATVFLSWFTRDEGLRVIPLPGPS
jgi:hypothetical protein